MKPTVIGGGQKPTTVEPTKVSGPTTIASAPVKPTSIAGDLVKTAPTKIMTPRQMEHTIVPLSSDEFKTQYETLKAEHKEKYKPTKLTFPDPVVKTVAHPSALPGKVIKPLTIELRELEARFIGQDTEVLEEVRRILSTVSPETFSSRDAVMFGFDVQKKNGELTHRWLEVLQGDALRKNSRHLERLREVLNDVIDDIGKKSWFRKQTMREKFEDDRPELEQLKKLLEDGMYQLNMAHLTLNSLVDEVHHLIRVFTAYPMVCEILSEKLPQDDARLVIDRGISFAKSLTLLHESALQIEQNLQSITGLITQIQDGVMVGIPTLISTIASANGEETDTQRYLLKEKILDIIRKIT